MNDRLYRLESKSEHRGEVIIRDLEADTRHILSMARYNKDRRSVYTVGEMAKFFNFHRKVLSHWLQYLEYPAHEHVYQENVDNPVSSKRSTKFYTKEDVLQIYDILIRIRKRGKPAKDTFLEPKLDLPTRPELLAMLNDSEVYYIKKGDEYFPVFRPEWS